MVALFLLLFSQTPAPNSLQQGLLALRDNKLQDARTSFEVTTQQDPKNAFAWVSLAETCRRQDDKPCATNAAEKAEQFGYNLPAINHALAAFYTQEGQFARAAEMEEKYSASPKADPQSSLRTAELYQHANDEPNAERVLKSTWEQRETDPVVAFRYSQLLLQKMDFAGADKVMTPALAAHPNDPQLILVAGVVAYGERRFADGMDDFLKVIEIDPAAPQPYAFLGKMLETAGPKLPEITKVLEARVKTVPDDALANLVLAKIKLMGNAKDPEAEALLRHSLAIDATQWETHYELGVLLESKHEFKDAADELTRSIALDPKQSMPHYHLARVYDRLGEPDRAQAERKLHEELSDAAR